MEIKENIKQWLKFIQINETTYTSSTVIQNLNKPCNSMHFNKKTLKSINIMNTMHMYEHLGASYISWNSIKSY